MTRDTLFRIASMTKPVTSIAALMLVEDGRLKLDDPVTKWLPELSEMQVLKDPAGPIDQTYPAPRDITVEDLMTHRAGLAYAFTSVGPIAQAHEDRLGPPIGTPLTPDGWLKALGDAAPLLPAGRAVPLQPRQPRCWASWSPGSRAGRWARCCRSGFLVRWA